MNELPAYLKYKKRYFFYFTDKFGALFSWSNPRVWLG